MMAVRARGIAAAVLVVAVGAVLAGAAWADDSDVMARGKSVFTEGAQPSCAICHTLAAAGATGLIGPVLDDLKPDAGRVRAAVAQGVGVMPPYGGSLSQDEIDAVAAFVAASTGGS